MEASYSGIRFPDRAYTGARQCRFCLCPDSTDSGTSTHQFPSDRLCMAVFRSPRRCTSGSLQCSYSWRAQPTHHSESTVTRRATLSKCHNNTVGHFGVERTCQLIREPRHAQVHAVGSLLGIETGRWVLRLFLSFLPKVIADLPCTPW
jgi:hypothetical protein